MKSPWNRIDALISRIEKSLIVILLSVMVLVAVTQIIMRNAFSSGLSWGEPLIRYLVLWVGFIGAALATREGKHITIELFSVWKSGAPRWYTAGISNLCSTLVCALLAAAAVKFLWFEAQMGTATFFNIPVWIPEAIIPLTFVIMSIRFFVKALSVIFGSPQSNLQTGPRSDP